MSTKILTPEIVKKELVEIASTLGIPIENIEVLRQWNKRHPLQKGLTAEAYDMVIFPLYFPSDQRVFGVRINEKGKVIAIKRAKESEWEKVI